MIEYCNACAAPLTAPAEKSTGLCEPFCNLAARGSVASGVVPSQGGAKILPFHLKPLKPLVKPIGPAPSPAAPSVAPMVAPSNTLVAADAAFYEEAA